MKKGYRTPEYFTENWNPEFSLEFKDKINAAKAYTQSSESSSKIKGYLEYVILLGDLDLHELSYLISYSFYKSGLPDEHKKKFETQIRITTWKLDFERHKDNFQPNAVIDSKEFSKKEKWLTHTKNYYHWKSFLLEPFENEQEAASFYLELINIKTGATKWNKPLTIEIKSHNIDHWIWIKQTT